MKIQLSKEKTILIISILFALAIVFDIYYFSIKKAIDTSYQNTYQKGVMAGRNQLWSENAIQLFSMGQLKMTLPATGYNYDIKGTSTKEIILIQKQ